nr:MAG TPA: Elongation factor 2, exotoxin A factor, toxin, ADP-ribosylation, BIOSYNTHETIC [Caudoviricetes sp.]
MIFTIISTFSLLANSYVFGFHGTNTEQTKRAITSPLF